MQALAALLIPARIGGLLFLLAPQDFNKYVEEVSARPEAVKQMAERLLNDGDVLTYLAIALRRQPPSLMK